MGAFGARIFKKSVQMICKVTCDGGRMPAKGRSFLCRARLLLRGSVPDLNRTVVASRRQLVSVPTKGDDADHILVPAQRQ